MRKIPTLFMRDENDRRYVTREVSAGCEWVLDGDGVATRKYDGTCIMFDGERWWARREVKPGKTAPDGFQQLGTDETTGKMVGWEPVEQSSFYRYFAEAVADIAEQPAGETFELVGPKINGNPENYPEHRLICHSLADEIECSDRSYDGITTVLAAAPRIEGIVFHRDNGDMAKIKRRDFPSLRPSDD